MSFVRIFFTIIFLCTLHIPMSIYAVESTPTVKSETQDSIDINTASVEKLTTIKGISAKKAQAIVDYRNKNGSFKSINDLVHVKGFSQSSLNKIIKNNPGRLTVKTWV